MRVYVAQSNVASFNADFANVESYILTKQNEKKIAVIMNEFGDSAGIECTFTTDRSFTVSCRG